MKRSAMICVMALGLGTGVQAQQACSPTVIQDRSAEMVTALRTIGERDADRVQVISQEIEDMMNAIQSGTGDLNEVCAMFDRVIAEAG
ncbi:hypothetical protein [Yoonia sp. SS1-5]|uniref:Uncharacterized protein n=1 Tax=Yoonia rhodophyticola TaxID=3137370 RepID=A0AAN0MF09_9RHOB